MNRTTVSIVLAASCLLVACGNKGELFLETDQAIADEIKQLDESLDELDKEPTVPTSNVSETDIDADQAAEPLDDAGETADADDAEEAIKKAKKKADELLKAAE